MATNKLVYDRTYNQGDALRPWHVRLRINLRSLPLSSSGVESNAATLAANSLANVEMESVGDFGGSVEANNLPRVRETPNVAWTMLDTPAYDFRTNIILPAVEQASEGLRLYVRFDCDYGMIDKGAWASGGYNEFDSVTDAGVRYVCVLTHATGHAPPNATYWLVVDSDASLFMRDFTGIVDPVQLGTQFPMADFANNMVDERIKLTAFDAVQMAFETIVDDAGFPHMYWLSTVGPDYPDTADSLFFTAADWKRAKYYQTNNTQYPWNGDTFQKDWWHKTLTGTVIGAWNPLVSNTTGDIVIYAGVYWTAVVPATDLNWPPNALGNRGWTKGGTASGGASAITDFNFSKIGTMLRAFANLLRWSLDGGMPGSGVMTLAYSFVADHFALRYGAAGACGYPNNDLADTVVLSDNKHIRNKSKGAGTTYAYCDYNLDGGFESGGNCTTMAESLALFLEQSLLYANFIVDYGAGGVERVNVRARSPISPTVLSFVSGDPELISIKDTLSHTPAFTPASRASASVKRPEGPPAYEHMYALDTPGAPTDPSFRVPDYEPFDDTPYDFFNPTYTAPLQSGSATVNITLIAGTFWGDWPNNQLSFLYDPIGHPDDVVAADFDMTLVDTGTYPPNKPVTICLTWGGGMLNGVAAKTTDAQSYQHAVALAAYSLYCGGPYGDQLKGMEKQSQRTRITAAMIGLLPDAILRAYKARGYDGAAYRYMAVEVRWNSWKIKGGDARTVALTGVRTIGY